MRAADVLYGKKIEHDPRRVWLDDKDCERMTRSEFNAVRTVLVTAICAENAAEDMQKRLECIPNGKQRYAMALGGLRAVANDLVGTTTKAQANQLWNTLNDLSMQFIPKLAPGSKNVIYTSDVIKDLVDCARSKCSDCVLDGESCRSCKLYKVLESTTPLNDYGDGLICPYALQDWED